MAARRARAITFSGFTIHPRTHRFSLPCASSVRQKPYDDTPLPGAQSAVGARYVTTLGRADDDFSSGGRVDSVTTVSGQHDDDGTAVRIGKSVRFDQGVRAQIDRETVPVCMAHCRAIHGLGLRVAEYRFVGVRPASPASVCPRQLPEFRAVNFVTMSGQIARLIVPPELTGGKAANLAHELIPRNATLPTGDGTPV